MAGDARSERSGCTATFGPTKPIVTAGWSALSVSAIRTSPANVGELVCSTTRSCWRASGMMSGRVRPAGGASTSLLPGTRAAGWASQVGYQYERISRRAWYLAPAPPSKPSKDGGLRNSVRSMWFRLLLALQVQADPLKGGDVDGFPAGRVAGGW